MAIVLNNTTTFDTSTSISHTTGSGSNRLLVLGVSSSNGNRVSNVQYAGVSLTQASPNPSNYGCTIWYLIAPATGANNLTFTAPSWAASYVGYIMDFTGAEQSSAVVDGAVVANLSPASSSTLNVTTANNNTFIVDVIRANNSVSLTKWGSQTQVFNTWGSPSCAGGSKWTTPWAAGVYGMAWTLGSSQFGSHVAVGFAWAAASWPANLKSYDTNVKANIKSINTNPIANIKSLNTNA